MKKIYFIMYFFITLNLLSQTPEFTIRIFTQPNNDTIIEDLLGVIAGPLPTPNSPLPDMTSQLQNIGVTGIRNNGNYNDRLDMESMFRCDFSDGVPSWWCSPDSMNNYYFEASDTLFRAILRGNFFPYFRLGGEPQCDYDSLHHVFHGPQDVVAENNLIKAMVKVVEHYDTLDGGTNNLSLLNLWTEWPNTEFWQRPNSEFIVFFTKALDTLNNHFPDKKIGGPGLLVPTVKIIHGITMNNPAVDLLNSLYSNNVSLDFLSWHLWSCNPENFYLAGEQMRNFLDGTGDFSSVPWAGSGFFENTEIYCDAYGVPALYEIDGYEYTHYELYLLHNKEKGAAILSANWIALQQTNTKAAYYYRFADKLSLPDSVWGDYEGWSGLFYGDSLGTYKPHAYAFKLWSKITNQYPHKMNNDFPLIAENDTSKLWILSGKNKNNFAVLVSNIDSFPKNFKIDINGYDLSEADFFVAAVNDENNGESVQHTTNNNFIIPGYTVLFVEIKNAQYTGFSNSYKIPEVFPNPSEDEFFLKNAQSAILNIYDIYGHKVKNEIYVNSNNFALNMSELPSGMYFLKIQKGKEVKILKILKQ